MVGWMEKEAALSITTHPMAYWRTVDASDPTILLTVESDMVNLYAQMKGRKRTEKRKQVNKAVAVREANREMGKVGQVIKSVLGT